MPLSLWQQIIDVNLTGAFLVSRAAAASLRTPGSLTLIASAGGLCGHADWSAYVASKFGVVGLARSLAQELAPHGIRVNAVCPGGVRTPMVARTSAAQAARDNVTESAVREQENSRVPLGRMAEPEEVASVCCFLASDLAAHVAGTAVLVDGAENA